MTHDREPRMNNKPDVLVIGLGAMGAAITYQLALRGVNVVGIDQYTPPHSKGSTHGETRITRQGIGEGLQFVPLAQRSHELWREIEEASGEGILNECGGLVLARTGHDSHLHGRKDFLGATIEAAESFDIPHEVQGADDISGRFPQFNFDGDERVYFEPTAGYVKPEAAVAAQLGLAEKHGALLIKSKSASLRQVGDDTIVECAGSEYRPGKTVVAAGAWASSLLPELESQLSVSRQLLFWFALDGSVSYVPEKFPVFIWNWGSREDDIFYGFPQVGDKPEIKVATEQTVTTTTPGTINRRVTENEIAEMTQRHMAGRLRGVTSDCVRAATCLYTTTPDSNFIIGWLPKRSNTLVISACSGHGFKHSAAIGEAVSEMIVSGETPEVLRPFRL